MRRRRVGPTTGIWLFIAAALSPLFALESLPSGQDSLITRYSRGLNTDEWEGRLAFQNQTQQGIRLVLQETFSSSRLIVGAGQNRWKDEHRLTTIISKPLTPSFSWNLLGSSLLFSDKQSGYMNDIRTHFLGAGGALRGALYRIPAYLGVKDDTRFKQHDFGLTGMIGADMPRFRFGEYVNSFQAQYEADKLEKRKNENLSVGYRISRQFYTDTSDSLRFSWQKGRRDYYISTAGEIESRDEQGLTAQNVLVYPMNEHLKYRVEGRFSNRDLDINVLTGPNAGPKRQRKDFDLEGAIHMIWNTSHLNGVILFRYSGQEERYILAESLTNSPYSGGSQLVTPDNKSQLATLSFKNNWTLSVSDTLSWIMNLQRYRYDTPDLQNYDDRDELRFHLDLQASHRFSPKLSARMTVSTHLLHLVYIYGEKSADNNWTRIFRLNPSVAWQPTKRVRLAQSVELLSNYVDYDFETLLPGVRSFVYRKYQAGDTLEVQMTRRSAFFLYYKLELDENGKLVWQDWVEQKLTDRQSHTVNLFLDFRPWVGFHFMPGYSYFYRKGFRYQLNTRAEQFRELYMDFKSHGPVLRLQYQGHRLVFILSGNTIATRTLSSGRQLLTRVDCRMSWLL